MRKWIYIVSICILIFLTGGCTGIESKDVPSIIVKVDGIVMDSRKGSYEWSVRKWFTTESVIADVAAPNQIGEEMKAGKIKQGSVAGLTFSDGSKPEIKSYLWNEYEEVKELSVSNQTITLPSDKGRHVIEVRGLWPNGEVSYTFVVEVL